MKNTADIKTVESKMVDDVFFPSTYETVEARRDPLEWQKRGLMYTATGYGAKIPTEHKVNFAGRWRRVYVTIWGNAGSTWINCKGKKLIVNDITTN